MEQTFVVQFIFIQLFMVLIRAAIYFKCSIYLLQKETTNFKQFYTEGAFIFYKDIRMRYQ